MTRARNNADSGLSLIDARDISGSSGVSYSNLTSGRRYRLVGFLYGSTNSNLSFRFRENSTDKSSGYYGASFYARFNASTGVVGNENNGSAIGNLTAWGTGTSAQAAFFYDIYLGAVSANLSGLSFNTLNIDSYYTGFANNAMTNCNGFTIYPASGTFTGSLKLYEYR